MTPAMRSWPSPGRISTSPTPRPCAPPSSTPGPTRWSTARPGPTSTAPKPRRPRRPPSTATARATSPPRRPRPAPCSCTSPVTTCSTARLTSRTRKTRRPGLAPRTGGRSWPASERSPATASRSCGHRGCSARTAATSSTRCGALGAERDEVAVVERPDRLPDVHRASCARARRDRRARLDRHPARRRRPAAAPGSTSPWRRSRRPASTADVRPQATAELGRPAPRPAFSALASTRSDAPVLPDWREGLRAHLARVEVTTQ